MAARVGRVLRLERLVAVTVGGMRRTLNPCRMYSTTEPERREAFYLIGKSLASAAPWSAANPQFLDERPTTVSSWRCGSAAKLSCAAVGKAHRGPSGAELRIRKRCPIAAFMRPLLFTLVTFAISVVAGVFGSLLG